MQGYIYLSILFLDVTKNVISGEGGSGVTDTEICIFVDAVPLVFSHILFHS